MKLNKKIKPYMEKAIDELKKKTLNEVHKETALTWCGRACAAAAMGLPDDAIEYAHESVEHAALSGDDKLLSSVREAFAYYNIDLYS